MPSGEDCIEVKCQIKLTQEYCKERIEGLNNPKDRYTETFLKLYGEEHYKQVLAWYHQALADLG